MKTSSISTQFAIYDTEYKFTDLGDKIEVTYPAGKFENDSTWILKEKKEIIDNPERISLIRKMIETGEPYLRVKKTGMEFTIAEVVFGRLDDQGWKVEDFE